MAFSLLYKLECGDKDNTFALVETDISGNIVEEPWDKGLNHRVTLDIIEIKCRKKGQKSFQRNYYNYDDKFDFYITESRLIFKLRLSQEKVKFKGSLIDYGLDTMLQKSENAKVEGYVVVGQIRYEWLAQIMYFEKKKKNDNNMLRFSYVDEEATAWSVTVSFTGDMDVKFIANEILHMACRYKDRMKCDKAEELQQFLDRYKTEEIPAAENPNEEFSSVSFPEVLVACLGSKERPDL